MGNSRDSRCGERGDSVGAGRDAEGYWLEVIEMEKVRVYEDN